MHAAVKECIENRDIKRLRYIFLDCLDVDPTFEKYREDYEASKQVEGLFEFHQELNGIVESEGKWDIQYWDQLKSDLMKNFSEKRFEHMIRVAKVVYADKVKRLIQERKESNTLKNKVEIRSSQSMNNENKKIISENSGSKKITSSQEMEARRIENEKKALEAHNRRIEEEQRKQLERIEASRKAYSSTDENRQREDDSSKKWLGIVLVLLIILIIVLIILTH